MVGKNVRMEDGKEKNVVQSLQPSTAATTGDGGSTNTITLVCRTCWTKIHRCGWQFENGYDESIATIKGR